MIGGKKGSGVLNGFLDRGARFEGTLSFEDTFRIDGVLKGKVVSKNELDHRRRRRDRRRDPRRPALRLRERPRRRSTPASGSRSTRGRASRPRSTRPRSSSRTAPSSRGRSRPDRRSAGPRARLRTRRSPRSPFPPRRRRADQPGGGPNARPDDGVRRSSSRAPARVPARRRAPRSTSSASSRRSMSIEVSSCRSPGGPGEVQAARRVDHGAVLRPGEAVGAAGDRAAPRRSGSVPTGARASGRPDRRRRRSRRRRPPRSAPGRAARARASPGKAAAVSSTIRAGPPDDVLPIRGGEPGHARAHERRLRKRDLEEPDAAAEAARRGRRPRRRRVRAAAASQAATGRPERLFQSIDLFRRSAMRFPPPVGES